MSSQSNIRGFDTIPAEWGITQNHLKNRFSGGLKTQDGCDHYIITNGKYKDRFCFYSFVFDKCWRLVPDVD